MKKLSILFLLIIILVSCNTSKNASTAKPKTVFKSNDLIIKKISENVYQHISFINTESFGRVACNGMIVKDGKEAIVFDATTDDKSSEEMIQWIGNNLHCKIVAVIPTHFHEDNLGGLKAFHQHSIPSYASHKTITFAKKDTIAIPHNGFEDSLQLKLGNTYVTTRFFGEGHTKDNVIGYFPAENVLFGGCLIKELNATKGYLGDANTDDWPATVTKIKQVYPNVKTVIPGHGKIGGQALLDYTIKLFSK
ncbi:MAG: subclass B1 metallo-beta-lactamase [Niabella sp.]